MKPMIKWTALALAVCLPLSAQAHRAWMLPSATVLSGEDPWVTVDAAVSNDLFYFEHFPLRLKGIGDLDNAPAGGPPGMRPRPVPELQLIAPDGSQLKAENGSLGRYRSTFDLHLTLKGTYKLAVANEGLFASWNEDGKQQRWMGNPGSFAKDVPTNAETLKVSQTSNRMEVFVTSGNPTRDVLKPTGKGLELSPVTHPNDLFAGETAEFVFLLDGKPAADVAISVIPGGNRYRDELGEIKATTDAQGKVSITWPDAGMYWLEAELTSEKGISKPATERRASYSATLEVLPQ
ncbi:DUF4198 domain-containing protein [Pseudomonas sp. NPDC077382]